MVSLIVNFIRRHALALIALLLAIACGWSAVARRPRHGLMLTRFNDAEFHHQAGPAVFDPQVHFSSDQSTHPMPDWVRDHTSARWEGYVEAPRNGEYVFGLSSDDSGWLDIDGKRLVSSPGEHPAHDETSTVVLRKGFHRIRIDYVQVSGGAQMKVLWRLPSGYNTTGLLPVSMLFPTPPPPITWVDRVLRWMTSLLLLASAALFGRARIASGLARLRADARARSRLLAGLAVFALVLGVRLYDLNGAGETCDEWAYQGAGQVYAENLAAGIFDSEQWKANREHPAIGKLIYGYAYYNFGDSPSVGRATSAVLNSFTALFAFLLALRLLGLEVAVVAGVMLALLPPFVAHGKVAALDSPATFFNTLTIWLFFRGLHDATKRASSFAWMVVAMGLGIATKLTNGLLLPFVLAVYPLLHWRALRERGELRLPWSIYVLPGAAFLPFVACWPWLWYDPFPHLQETLNHWTYVPSELFLGHANEHAPAFYFLVCFAAAVPIALFPFFLTGAAQVFRRTPAPVLRAGAEDPMISDRAWWLLLSAWFLLPFGWSVSHFRQDGVRYVYAAFPAFAVLAGAGLVLTGWKVQQFLEGRHLPWSSRIVPALGGAVAVYLLGACVSVHPYYLDYFNEAVGGAKGVYRARLFETGWWGEGMGRAVDFMNTHAEHSASYRLDGYLDHLLGGLREDLRPVKENADYVIRTGFSPDTPETPERYQEAFTVRLQGVPLVGVYRRIEAQRPAQPRLAAP